MTTSMLDDLLYASVSKMWEAYLEPAQAFKMVLYAGKVNGIKLLSFFLEKAPYWGSL